MLLNPGRSTTFVVCVLLATVLLCVRDASAQTALAEVTGEVTDSTGATVPQAKVTLTNEATNVQTALETNEVGRYYIRSLAPGKYTIEAGRTGFKTHRAVGVEIQTGQVLRFDIGMEVGDVSSRVEVASSGAAVEVQKDSSDISLVLSTVTVDQMPKVTRKVLELVNLNPATVMTSKGGLNDNYAGASITFSVAGNPGGRSNNYLLDGITLNRARMNGDGGGQADIAPNPEITSEMRIVTRFSAEFGEALGATILMTTKSGTNQTRGEAYYYGQNDALDATPYFATGKNPNKFHNYGGVIGGPIIKNKTFYMFNFEHQRVIQYTPLILTLPTLAQRRGDFSGLRNGAGQPIIIYDPATTRTDPSTGRVVRDPFPGNIIPADRHDRVASQILNNFVADPNQQGLITGGNNFAARRKDNDSNRYWYFGRLDHYVGEKDRFYGRYVRDDGNSPRRGPFAGTKGELADPFEFTQVQFGQIFAGSWTRMISSSTLSEASVSYSNFPLDRVALGGNPQVWQQNWAGKLGLSNLGPDTFPSFQSAGYSDIGSWSFVSQITHPVMRSLQIGETLSLTRGRHNIRFGGTGKNSRGLYATRSAASGAAQFDPRATALPNVGGTGDSMASFLLGQVASARIHDTPPTDYRSWFLTGFVQDDWRIRRNLTLNLGLRYEYDTPKVNVSDNNSFFNFDKINPVCNCPGVIEFASNRYKRVEDAFSHDHTPVYRQPTKQFAPRIGLAYSPWSGKETVVRAGFGIFYAGSDYGDVFWEGPVLGSGTVANYTSDALGTVSPFRLQDGFPRTPVEPLTDAFGAVPLGELPRINPTFFYNNRRAAYSLQYNFSLQQRLGGSVVEVGYLGNGVRKLAQPGGYLNYNEVRPERRGPGNAQLLRPFPQFGNVLGSGENRYTSNYHAGFVSLKRSFANGLTFQTNYTFSKHLDNQGPRSYYDMQQDYGPSSLQVRHRFVWSSNYELPFGRGKPLANTGGLARIFGGWSVGTIVDLRSGRPFSIGSNTNTCNCFSMGNQGVDVASGVDWRQEHDKFDPRKDTWMNPAGFVFAQPYRFGNAGKGIIEGPGLATVDVSLLKDTRITERVGLEIRGEFFNAFNHPNFGNPNGTLGSATFGRVTSTTTDPRRIQLGARLKF